MMVQEGPPHTEQPLSLVRRWLLGLSDLHLMPFPDRPPHPNCALKLMVGEGPSCPLVTPLPLLSPVHMSYNKIGETRVVLSAFPLSRILVSSILGLTPLVRLAWQMDKGAWLECL